MLTVAIFLILATRMTLIAGGPPTGEATLLRVHPERNATFTYNIKTTYVQQIDVSGQQTSSGALNELTVHLLAKDVTLDRTMFTCTFSNAKAKFSVQGLDADMPKNDTLIDLPSFDGITTSIITDPHGAIQSVSAQSDLALTSLLTSMKVMERIIPTFPVKALQVGDSWGRSTIDTTGLQQGIGSIITSTTTKQTFRGSKDTLGYSCWLIESVSTDFQQTGTVSTNGIEMDLNGSGSQITRLFIERQTGMIVISVGEVMSDTRMVLTGQQEMVIPIDTHLSFVVQRQSRNK